MFEHIKKRFPASEYKQCRTVNNENNIVKAL